MPATVEMPDRDGGGTGIAIQVTMDLLEFKDMLFMKMTDIDQVQLPPIFAGCLLFPILSPSLNCGYKQCFLRCRR